MGLFNNIFGKGKDKGNEKAISPDGQSFENVSSRLFPYFKQFLPEGGPSYPLPDDLSKIDRTKTYSMPELEMVYRNICEDLNCLYVIDGDTGFEIVQERHLQEWDIDKETLHETAIHNFRLLISQKLSVQGDTNAVMLIVDGNLEAGLVLIDEIWEQLEDQIGEQVVIAVPSRDVVMATGKSNREMIERLKDSARGILQTGDHPLSKNLFIREGVHWKLFESVGL